MKNFTLLLILLLTGCSTLSSKEKEELRTLQCEKVFAQISELRTVSAESALFSLAYGLYSNGISSEMVSGILGVIDSEEAKDAYQIKYKEQLDELSTSILDSSGCLSHFLKKEEKLNKKEQEEIKYNSPVI